MDCGLKVHKVAGVVLQGPQQRLVDLHLTQYHTILKHTSSGEEIWIPHSLLLSIHLHATSRHDPQARIPLVIRSRTFTSHTILFGRKSDARNVYESLEGVVARRTSSDQLYAYRDKSSLLTVSDGQPNGTPRFPGWTVYDPRSEYARMGIYPHNGARPRTNAWRFTSVNAKYEYCSTYPAALVVPSKISDSTLNYGKTYRSKARIPSLVYLHWNNFGTITRSSQPMVGIKNNRSIQDEKLIEAVFTSHSLHTTSVDATEQSYISHSQQVYGATATNLIIDARPTTNAMANVAKGAGTENMDYYRNCKKVYLGIDNIHVMRDSLARVAESIRQPKAVNYDLLRRSGWLRHLTCILEGIVVIVKAVHLANSHVLVHCSDGWDRTSQLSALSQLCLDPYYRTLNGFAVLVEKDWVSFGHKFQDRCGHLVPSRVQFVSMLGASDEEDEDIGFLTAMQGMLNFSGNSQGFKETCPVFDQYLDCVHQLLRQFPERFEYNNAFLLDLQRSVYECEHGTFLYNSEQERHQSKASQHTSSVWEKLLDPQARSAYVNAAYNADDHEVLFPDPKNVTWWTAWFKCDSMNDVPFPAPAGPTSQPTIVVDSKNDPVVQETILTPARVPTPSSRADNSHQRSLDSATVTHAATAVHGAYHGAIRSAWSAWKTVKQTYDGNVRENDVGEPASAPMTDVASSSSRSSESAHPIVVPRDDKFTVPLRSQSPGGVAPSMSASFTEATERVRRTSSVIVGETANSPRAQQPKATETHNSWTAAVHADTDPFGIKTWS